MSAKNIVKINRTFCLNFVLSITIYCKNSEKIYLILTEK
ncbi:hypothetical protein AC062_0130 [Pasteurellaceae bacterium NI1060]|nr:hypothetical protein AC062_0130 [Pasteurellaceae bacterium NI1060]